MLSTLERRLRQLESAAGTRGYSRCWRIVVRSDAEADERIRDLIAGGVRENDLCIVRRIISPPSLSEVLHA